MRQRKNNSHGEKKTRIQTTIHHSRFLVSVIVSARCMLERWEFFLDEYYGLMSQFSPRRRHGYAHVHWHNKNRLHRLNRRHGNIPTHYDGSRTRCRLESSERHGWSRNSEQFPECKECANPLKAGEDDRPLARVQPSSLR